MPDVMQQSNELAMLRARPEQATAELFGRYHVRLVRVIELHLDPRVLGKVDSDDILQDVFIQAARRIRRYLDDPAVPVFVWLRQLAIQAVIDVHRRYLGAAQRDVRQEVPIWNPFRSDRSSAIFAAQLADSLTTPSQCAIRGELVVQMQSALNSLSSSDQEVLLLRHMEGLSNNEVAHVLSLDKHAASKRYVRALERLRSVMPSPA